MKISTAIITQNRSAKLKQCLESLLKNQSRSTDELIIVNGGDDNTSELVERFRNEFPFIKLIGITNKGVSNSRNIAVVNCTKEIIAFIDDDAIPARDWIEKILINHQKHPEAGGIGGRVLNSNKRNYIARLEQILYFRDPLPEAGYVRTIPTVNISYKKSVMDRVGIFDENLFVGEDVDYNWRIAKRGFKIFYQPEIIVSHSNITCLGSFLRHHFISGRGYFQTRSKWPDLPSIIPCDFRTLRFFFTDIVIRPLWLIKKHVSNTDKIVFIPVMILREIAFRFGILFQKFFSK